jgi:hypothetical protein
VRKRPITGSPTAAGEQILQTQPIENVLSRRRVFNQGLGGEIHLRQRICEGGVNNVLEAIGGRRF